MALTTQLMVCWVLVLGLCFVGPSAKDSFCGEYRQKQCSDSAGANEKALYEQGVKLGLALEVRKWSGSTGGRLKIGINHAVSVWGTEGWAKCWRTIKARTNNFRSTSEDRWQQMSQIQHCNEKARKVMLPPVSPMVLRLCTDALWMKVLLGWRPSSRTGQSNKGSLGPTWCCPGLALEAAGVFISIARRVKPGGSLRE